MMKSDGKFLDFCVVEESCEFAGHVSNTLVHYWNEKLLQSDRAGPWLSQIDLMELYEIAPFIVIKDIINGGEEYKNRYWGTGITRAFGYDSTGKLIGEYYEDVHIVQLKKLYEFIVSKKRPVKLSGSAEFFADREFVTFESVHMPLYDKAGAPSHILMGYDFLMD